LSWNPTLQAPNWSGPFFSGAANLDISLQWNIYAADIEQFKSLTLTERNLYRFQTAPAGQTTPYLFSANRGFVLIVWMARNIFFWLSDAHAMRAFQLIVHLALSVMLISLFQHRHTQILVWLAYTVNPVIIYLTTFPHYYFWQALPSLWVVMRYFAHGTRARVLDITSPILFFLMFYTQNRHPER
jgi:hypothetical protein